MIAGVAALTAFLLLLITVAVQWFWPSSPVQVSESTTFMTTPLREDGSPDFQHAVRQYEDIPDSLEQNGAVLFWQAVGEPSLSPSNWTELCTSLQIDPQRHQQGLSFTATELHDKITHWVHQSHELSPSDTVDTHSVLSRATAVPWRREECPPLFDAIQRHQQNLEWLHEATSKPSFYSPPLSQDPVCDLRMEIAMALGTAVDGLLQRAQLSIASGELDLAWDDIQTSLILCNRVPPLYYIGFTVRKGRQRRAIDALCSLLSHPDLSESLAKTVFEDRGLFGDIQALALLSLRTERLFSLSFVVDRSRNPNREQNDPVGFLPPEATRHLQAGSVDWNFVLRYMNRRFDEMEAILSEPLHDRRWLAWRQLDADRQSAWVHVQSQVARGIGFFSRRQRSQLIAEEFMDSSISSFGIILRDHHFMLATERLLPLVRELVLHRLRRGILPPDLESLASESAPFDRQSIAYQRLESGFLLYEFGFNGSDDGGSNSYQHYHGIQLAWSSCDRPGALKRILTRYGEADAVTDDHTLDMLIPEHADDVAFRIQVSPSSLGDAISDGLIAEDWSDND